MLFLRILIYFDVYIMRNHNDILRVHAVLSIDIFTNNIKPVKCGYPWQEYRIILLHILGILRYG